MGSEIRGLNMEVNKFTKTQVFMYSTKKFELVNCIQLYWWCGGHSHVTVI